MYRFFILLVSAALAVAVSQAQTVASGDSTIVRHINADSLGMVHVYQPYELDKRLAPEESTDEEEQDGAYSSHGYTIGYRVQVFADNNHRTAKNEAQIKERNIISRFPMVSTYISYKAPSWRLRVGDFRTHEEALEMLNEIKKAFPSYSREVIIVRDRINLK